MSRTSKIIVFFIVLFAGSFLIAAFGRMFLYYLVALTGWGWLFSIGSLLMVAVFWLIMFLKFWPKKPAADTDS